MRHGTLCQFGILMLLATAGCAGGSGAVGDRCGSHDDCEGGLQCQAAACVPRCQRAPQCGDGYACDDRGLCRRATGQTGDACTSETQCAPGLACRIDGDATDPQHFLLASCAAPTPAATARPAGGACELDSECRDGTCALGHCLDLCASSRDCAAGDSCQTVPRGHLRAATLPGETATYAYTSTRGCLPAHGTIEFAIPVPSSGATISLPVPSGAQEASLVIAVDESGQLVGATDVIAPSGMRQFQRCVSKPADACQPELLAQDYYSSLIRHLPLFAQSTLAIPSKPTVPLEVGDYRVTVASLSAAGARSTAVPRVTAVIRIDTATTLDLHFHFLDLADHPCQAASGGVRLAAGTAAAAPFFQSEYLVQLRTIFARAGIAIGAITYDDILDHPELDALDLGSRDDPGTLLALGEQAAGVNLYFVRSLSPAGVQAFGPNPGPGGLAHTRQSGIAIGTDTLCYRSWSDVARLTAHELAHYMGLYHNREPTPQQLDPIDDSDEAPDNLMFYSELGGTVLSAGQRDILLKSPVLR